MKKRENGANGSTVSPNEVTAAEAQRLAANPEPHMLMLGRDLVVRLAEQHRLAITIRPDGSIFGLSHHLDRLRALVKDELTRAAAKQAGGAA